MNGQLATITRCGNSCPDTSDELTQQLGEGASYEQIEQGLAARGLTPQQITDTMLALGNIATREVHRQGRRNIYIGAVIAVVGLSITAGSFVMAGSSPEGGRYVVTYGVIFVGAAQCIRGIVQISR